MFIISFSLSLFVSLYNSIIVIYLNNNKMNIIHNYHYFHHKQVQLLLLLLLLLLQLLPLTITTTTSHISIIVIISISSRYYYYFESDRLYHKIVTLYHSSSVKGAYFESDRGEVDMTTSSTRGVLIGVASKGRSIYVKSSDISAVEYIWVIEYDCLCDTTDDDNNIRLMT
jgi:hypothetical protein